MANQVREIPHNQQAGDTIHVPQPNRSSATSKSANSQVTVQADSNSDKTVNIDQHWHYAKLIEDMHAVQADYDLMSIYTEDAGYALAKQVDTHLHQSAQGWTAAGSTNNDADFTGTNALTGDGNTWDDTANTSTGNGAAITDAGLRFAIRQLDENDVPMDNRVLVIPPVEKENMLGISRFTEQAFTGEQAANNSIRKGMFGQVYGVDVFVSNNVQTVTAADTSTEYFAALLFHRDASVHVPQQEVRVQSEYQLDYLGNLLVADTIYGYDDYRPNNGVPVIVSK